MNGTPISARTRRARARTQSEVAPTQTSTRSSERGRTTRGAPETAAPTGPRRRTVTARRPTAAAPRPAQGGARECRARGAAAQRRRRAMRERGHVPVHRAPTDWVAPFLRPPPPADIASRAIAFQWVSIDMYTGDPLPSHPRGGRVPGGNKRPVPIVRLYGSTEEGQSVCAHCHGFTPYCFAQAPPDLDPDDRSAGPKMRARMQGPTLDYCSSLLTSGACT